MPDDPKPGEGKAAEEPAPMRTSKWQPLIDGIKAIGIPALLTILGLVFAVAWALPKGIELSISKLGETQQSLGQLEQRVEDAKKKFETDESQRKQTLEALNKQVQNLQNDAATTAEFLSLLKDANVDKERVKAVLEAVKAHSAPAELLEANQKRSDDIRTLAAAVDRIYSDGLFRQGDAPAWHSLLLQHYGIYKDRLTQMQSTPPATQPAK